MKRSLFTHLFFSFIFIANVALANPESEIIFTEVAATKEKKPKEKNKCDYESECTCKKYKTSCAMLPLPVNRKGYVFAEGEYLYWKTYGLFPYSTKRFLNEPFDIGIEPWSYNLKRVDMSADSGYRVTLGFYLSKCWSLRTIFRRYDANGTDNFSTTLDPGLPNLSESISYIWSLINFNNIGNFQVSSKQRYREKIWDIDFARAFVCYRFTLNPFIGVRLAWVKSDSRINYNMTGDPPIVNNHVDINNRFNLGVGLHTGIDTNMDFGKGFGFYGHSQLAILIGQFKYRIKEQAARTTSSGVTLATVTQILKVTDFQTNWSLGTGLNWGHHFRNCGYYFGLKLGYEANVWPDFISVFKVISSTNRPSSFETTWRRSILTHGLVLGARFDF